MTLLKKMLGAAATVAASASFAVAEPALIFDLGGKFDKSFNELAFTGAQRWAEDTGMTFRDIELQSEAQREQALRRFAEAGNNPIVMTGFAFASALGDVAADYPDTKFTIIDMVVEAPNVRSIVFKEHEGSYLVGMMAAQASKSGTVGFIGGQDVPLIRRFACGYAQGAKVVNAEIKVVANMTGTTPAAWNDPVKGSELTKAQISQGADVIYAVAGGTGVGILQTAADENILSIGVDSNQNYMHPGKVLTSMTKGVDNAVYNAFSDGPDMETGVRVMGLNNRGVGFAMDEHNAGLVSDAMAAAAYKAAYDIASGAIAVHDYTSDDSCPDLSF
jgi:basic membrane protein A